MTPTTPWAVQREAATRLGISERTLHRWRAAGLLKAANTFAANSPIPIARCSITWSTVSSG